MNQKAKSGCEICNESFNFFLNREHQCKRCKRSVCKNCGRFQDKVVLSLMLPPKDERICAVCKEDQDFQKMVQTANRTTWNFNSKITQVWLKFLKITSLESIRVVFDEAKTSLNNSLIVNNQQDVVVQSQVKAEVQKMFNEPLYWNYSFIAWFQKNIRNVKREDVSEAIKKLVGTLLHMNPEIGYSREVVQMAAFLLTFSRDYVAYAILQRIYFQILPDTLLPSSYMSANIIAIQEDLVADSMAQFQQQFKLQPADLPVVKNFMEYCLIQYKSTLFLNLLNFQIVFNLLNESLDAYNSSIIDRYFLSMVKLNMDQIKKLGVSKVLRMAILKETQIKDMKEIGQQVEEAESKAPLLGTMHRRYKSRKTLMVINPNNEEQEFNDQKSDHMPKHRPNNKSMVNLNIDTTLNDDQLESPKASQIDEMDQSFYSQSQRNFSIEQDVSKMQQRILNEQQLEIQRLREQLRSTDQQIFKIQKENEGIQTKVKQKELNQINYRRACYNTFERLEELSEETFGGFIRELDLGIEPI